MRKQILALLTIVVIAACSGGGDGSTRMLDDPRWKALVAQMNLPDYKARRLEMYVGTLEDSRSMLAAADSETKTTATATLDGEIGRTLPLLVPPEFADRVYAFLSAALRGQ